MKYDEKGRKRWTFTIQGPAETLTVTVETIPLSSAHIEHTVTVHIMVKVGATANTPARYYTMPVVCSDDECGQSDAVQSRLRHSLHQMLDVLLHDGYFGELELTVFDTVARVLTQPAARKQAARNG